MIGDIFKSGLQVLRKTGEVGVAATRVVSHEVGQLIQEKFESSQAAPDIPQQLPLALRLTQGGVRGLSLADPQRRSLSEAMEQIDPDQVQHSSDLRKQLAARVGAEKVAEVSRKHPNFLPSLLANARSHPPLTLSGKMDWSFNSIPASAIQFREREGRLYAEVHTSLNQLSRNSRREKQIAEDYASEDVPLKLTLPLPEQGLSAEEAASLGVTAQRQLLQQSLAQAPKVTMLVHGFQSNKEIWDSTSATFSAPDSIVIAADGFGGDGCARSDGSAPYTPRQYGFQMLETLDALGVLGAKDLKVVGHSMGGAATGEMAVALDKAGYSGKADFLLMAPACSADHMPIFQSHRSALDVANAVLIGGIYVPLGAWQLTAPLVQWTDEKFPALSKMMVDHALDLKDSPEHIRDHNASYYRQGDPKGQTARRQRSLEAMLGMGTQKGIDPRELNSAARKFGVFVVNFGHDRLVDPTAVRRLKSRGVGYLEVPPGSHNACFDPTQAARIAARSDKFFAAR